MGIVRTMPAPFRTPYSTEIASTLIGSYSDAERSFAYSSVDSSDSATTPIASGNFEGTAPDGYLYSAVATDGTGTHLYDHDVVDGSTQDLGLVPGDATSWTAQATPTGVLVETHVTTAASDRPSLWFESYSTVGQFSQLATNVPLLGKAAFDGATVAWLENPTSYGTSAYDPAATTVTRIDVDGGTARTSSAPGAEEVVITPAFTGLETAATANLRDFMTVPAAGGAITTYGRPILGDVAASGDSFVFAQGGDAATAGLYSLPSASGTAVRLVAASTASVTADSIAVSPGRVVWRDDAVDSGIVTKTLVLAGGGITAGAGVVVVNDPASSGATASSGSQIAYIDDGGLWIATSGEPSQKLGPASPDDSLTLSGDRLLQGRDDGSAILYDLAASTSQTLPALVGPWGGAFAGLTPYQLSGDELAILSSDGSVSVKNLDSGAVRQVSDPVVSAGQTILGSVAVSGATVAWTEAICSPETSFVKCGVSDLHYRNAQTLGATITVPSVSPAHIQLSDQYLVFDDDPNGIGWSVDVNPLYSATVSQVAPIVSDADGSFAISGSTLGYIGSDGLPRVMALDPQLAQPWYLGDGIVPTTFMANGDTTWTPALATSEALTTCNLVISSGVSVIRSIPCDPAGMAVGEVTASWDGRDNRNVAVAAGTYSWTLHAANADGPLLNEVGDQKAVSGVIEVSTHSQLAVSASSSTGDAYDPVTLTATLAAPTAGTVEFTDGGKQIGSAAPHAGVAALTTSKLGPGAHVITAAFVPAVQGDSVSSAPVSLALAPAASATDPQSVQATVNPGTLTITTPYTPAQPLNLGTLQLDPAASRLVASATFGDSSMASGAIEVTDTRAGNSNWSVTAQASDFLQKGGSASINGQNLGLTGLTAITLPQNALTAADVAFVDAAVPAEPVAAGIGGIAGLGGTEHVIASTLHGGDGTIGFYGTVTLEAPTSTPAGVYTGTIVFTVG